MLQSARVTAFTVSKLLMENQQEGGRVGGGEVKPPTQVRVNLRIIFLITDNYQRRIENPIDTNLQLKVVNYFRKMIHLIYLTGFTIRF